MPGRVPEVLDITTAGDSLSDIPAWLQGDSKRKTEGQRVWQNYTHKFPLGQGCGLCVEKGIECRAELPRSRSCALCWVKVGAPPGCDVVLVTGIGPSRRGRGRRGGSGRGRGGIGPKRTRRVIDDSDSADDGVPEIAMRTRKRSQGNRPGQVGGDADDDEEPSDGDYDPKPKPRSPARRKSAPSAGAPQKETVQQTDHLTDFTRSLIEVVSAQTSAGQEQLSNARREIETEKAAIEAELDRMEREYVEERRRMEDEMQQKEEEMSEQVAEKKRRLAVLARADEYIVSSSGTAAAPATEAGVGKSPRPGPLTNGQAETIGLAHRESLTARCSTASDD